MNTVIANAKSVKGFKQVDGTTKEITVNVYKPTAQEWVEHFGGKLPTVDETTQKALNRFTDDYNQHKVANNLASKQKRDYALHLGLSDVKEPSEKSLKEAAETVRMLEAGDVFDLRDVVAKDAREGADKREVLVGFEKLLTMVGEKWETTPAEKRVAFIAKYKLELEPESTPATVASAIQAKYKAPVIATEDSELGGE